MLGNLKKLRKLDLKGTDIEELSDSIMSLEKLEFLSVAGCGRLKFLLASASVGSVLLTSDGASSSSGDQGNLTRPSVGEGSNGLQYSLPQFPPSLTELYAQGCYELEMIADVSNAKGLRELDLSGCPKLVDVPGVEQLKWLNSLKLGGCRSLYRSLQRRVQEAIFERLTDFSISGSLCELSSAREGQILSFFVPKWFKTGSLYLKLGESSLHGVVVGIAITTTDDGRLLFSTAIPARVWRPYDYFGESHVPKVKLGEYGETMMMMHVLIKGCLLLDGYLRSTTTDDVCGDMYFDTCDMSSTADIRVNFGGPIVYYQGLTTVLSVDFS